MEKESEEHEVTWDDEESTLHVTMTYNIYDLSLIHIYAQKPDHPSLF